MISLFFNVKAFAIFLLSLRCVGGTQGRCTLMRVFFISGAWGIMHLYPDDKGRIL